MPQFCRLTIQRYDFIDVFRFVFAFAKLLRLLEKSFRLFGCRIVGKALIEKGTRNAAEQRCRNKRYNENDRGVNNSGSLDSSKRKKVNKQFIPITVIITSPKEKCKSATKIFSKNIRKFNCYVTEEIS